MNFSIRIVVKLLDFGLNYCRNYFKLTISYKLIWSQVMCFHHLLYSMEFS